MNSVPVRYYAMHCPHCRTRLRVSSRDLGTTRNCPKCEQRIMIGKSPDRAQPSSAREEFAMACKTCGTRFFARPDQAGQAIDCPDCLTEHTVPQPPPSTPVARKHSTDILPRATDATDGADEYQLSPLDEEPLPPHSHPNAAADLIFHVRCQLCGTSLAASTELIGQTLVCPDCSSEVVVRQPPPKQVKPRVVAKDPKIGIDTAPELQVVKDQAQRLMKEAHEHQAELDRMKPESPKRPFIDGVYNYPLFPKVAPVWVSLTLLVFLVYTLVTSAMQQEGLSMVAAIPMMIFAAVLSIALVLTSGYCLMYILQSTAVGYRDSEEWPRFDFSESLGNALYFVSAIFISILPVMLMAAWLPSGVPLPAASLSCYILFPFLLMSMMDAGAPGVPFTPHVWRTLTVGRDLWLKFYATSSFVLGMFAAGWLAANHLPHIGNVVMAVLIALGATIYFRLLGRLAWGLDNLPVAATAAADAEKQSP